MKKHITILWVAFLLLFTVFAQPLSAATTSDGYVYTLSKTGTGETVATITGYTGSGGSLKIPSQIEGCTVEAIDDFAFAGNPTITGIVLPDSLYAVNACAFSGCTGITSLSVGKNFSDLGDGAFENCTALTSIQWNATFLFFDPYSKGAFANAGKAGAGISVSFGDHVQAIPDRLFYAEAAAEAPKVVSVSFGNELESVGQFAFTNCPLTAVVLSDSISYIGREAFAGCPLTEVRFGANLEQIANSAFAGCPFGSLDFPDQLKNIGENAFAGCANLSAVHFDADSSLYIGRRAFLNCPNLTSLTFPKGVGAIGSHALGYCYDGDRLTKTTLTISGYRYSPAEDYAQANQLGFTALGGVFSDVAVGAWYEGYVDDLVAKGIFNGYGHSDSSYSFAPEANITRAEFVTVLANASGDDLSSYAGKNVFLDVNPSGWAGKYVAWAFDHGIVTGIGSNKFMPEAGISRQDMAVMMLRFAADEKIDLKATVPAVAFADANSIAGYAGEAVTTLQQAGVIAGSVTGGKTYFNPQINATRAQAATMVSKLLALAK